MKETKARKRNRNIKGRTKKEGTKQRRNVRNKETARNKGHTKSKEGGGEGRRKKLLTHNFA
jgi:hypothetical protein